MNCAWEEADSDSTQVLVGEPPLLQRTVLKDPLRQTLPRCFRAVRVGRRIGADGIGAGMFLLSQCQVLTRSFQECRGLVVRSIVDSRSIRPIVDGKHVKKTMKKRESSVFFQYLGNFPVKLPALQRNF